MRLRKNIFVMTALFASLLTINAFAITGGTTTFDTFLKLNSDSAVPNGTFSYSVAAGTARNYNTADGKVQVLAGVSPGSVTVGSATFAPGDTTYNAVQTGDTIKDFTTGKYAKKTLTADFTTVNFTKPGIYRYVVTQGNTVGFTMDSDATRVIDVYVVNSAADATADATATLSIAGYVVHPNENDVVMGANYGSDGTSPANKGQGYTNSYATENLTLAKSVKGNQASADQTFKFDVTIGGTTAGSQYSVDISNANATVPASDSTLAAYVGQTNATTITVPAGATSVTTSFYLTGAQSIVIQGLGSGNTVAVTEYPEDYKAQVTVVGDDAAAIHAGDTSGTITIDGVASSDNVTFTNTKHGAVPTGVVMGIFPYVILASIGIFGCAYMVSKKKNNKI
jgi:hypothetical protein